MHAMQHSRSGIAWHFRGTSGGFCCCQGVPALSCLCSPGQDVMSCWCSPRALVGLRKLSELARFTPCRPLFSQVTSLLFSDPPAVCQPSNQLLPAPSTPQRTGVGRCTPLTTSTRWATGWRPTTWMAGPSAFVELFIFGDAAVGCHWVLEGEKVHVRGAGVRPASWTAGPGELLRCQSRLGCGSAARAAHSAAAQGSGRLLISRNR